jgi:large subunit ribosomal protein L21
MPAAAVAARIGGVSQHRPTGYTMVPFPPFLKERSTMYAIIRTGGKQAKVREGDVIDVERLRAEGEVTFTPTLLVADDGTVISARDELKACRVVARVVGESAGPKIDIFKYKAKTGYRRRQGHRQKYTTIEVTGIEVPGTPKQGAKAAEKPVPAAEEATAVEEAKAAEEAAAEPAAEAAPVEEAPKAASGKTTKKKAPAEPAAKED